MINLLNTMKKNLDQQESQDIIVFKKNPPNQDRGMFREERKGSTKNRPKQPASDVAGGPKQENRPQKSTPFVPAPSKGCQLNPKGWLIDTL